MALSEVAGVTRSTLALIETKPGRSMYDATSRAILESLAAAAPLTDEQCARFLELSGLSQLSKNGVLEDSDRERETELGVIADPADTDGRLRMTRRAFATYGARVARVRDIGMDQLARAKSTSPDAATSSMILSAHQLIDEIAAHGGILAVMGALLPLADDARSGRRVGAPRDIPPEQLSTQLPPLPPGTPAASSHTIQPGGRFSTVYKPEDQPPAKPQAKRKSG